MLGDLIDAAVEPAQGHRTGRVGTLGRGAASGPSTRPRAEYYLNLDVADRPGVLAAVAGVFGRHGVSIHSMEQEGPGRRGPPDLHHPRAARADMQATLHDLRDLDVVDGSAASCVLGSRS